MMTNKETDARKRMSRLLISEEIQKRIARLDVDRAEFSADMLSGIASTPKTSALNESEVFALFELAARLNLRLNREEGHAYLSEMNGHPAVTMDFANLHMLLRRIQDASKAV